METLVIQVESGDKIQKLIEFLKTLQYVVSIERKSNLQKARAIFNRLNEEAAKSEIAEMSEEEINALINEARHEYAHSH